VPWSLVLFSPFVLFSSPSLVLFSSLLFAPRNQFERTKRRRRNEEEELGLGFVRVKKESKKKN
jgi:hypothetical protein